MGTGARVRNFRFADRLLTAPVNGDHLLEVAAKLSRETGFPWSQTVTMLSYASTLSNGDSLSETRLAIFPGSMVPSCESRGTTASVIATDFFSRPCRNSHTSHVTLIEAV